MDSVYIDTDPASRASRDQKRKNILQNTSLLILREKEDECTQMRATSAMQLRHTSTPRTCCASFISVLIRSMSVKPAISPRTVDKVDRYQQKSTRINDAPLIIFDRQEKHFTAIDCPKQSRGIKRNLTL